MSDNAQDEAMLSLAEVGEFFGGKKHPLSRTTVYAWVKRGKIPRPIKLDFKISRWRLSQCRAARDALLAAQAGGTE